MKQKLGQFKSLKFPPELGTEQVPNFVRFEPKEFRFGGITSTKGNKFAFSGPSSNSGIAGPAGERGNNINLNGGLEGLVDGVMGTLSNVAKQTVGGVMDQLNQVGWGEVFGFKVGGAAGKFKVKIGDFSKSLEIGKDTTVTKGSINLFLPLGLQATTSIGYGAEELGGAGFTAAQSARDSNVSISDMGAVAFQETKKFLTDNALGKAVEVGKGLAANNFSYQIFEGVGHRTFGYEFRMIPRDEQDAVDIKTICDTFKYWALPARSADFETLYFEIPCMWDITYLKEGNEITFLDKPKECFLTDVGVNYNETAGQTFHQDGSPMEVRLSLKFVEIEPEFRG